MKKIISIIILLIFAHQIYGDEEKLSINSTPQDVARILGRPWYVTTNKDTSFILIHYKTRRVCSAKECEVFISPVKNTKKGDSMFETHFVDVKAKYLE